MYCYLGFGGFGVSCFVSVLDNADGYSPAREQERDHGAHQPAASHGDRRGHAHNGRLQLRRRRRRHYTLVLLLVNVHGGYTILNSYSNNAGHGANDVDCRPPKKNLRDFFVKFFFVNFDNFFAVNKTVAKLCRVSIRQRNLVLNCLKYLEVSDHCEVRSDVSTRLSTVVMLVRRFLASTALTLQRRAAPNLSSFRALDTASRGTGTCSFNRRHTIGYAAGMHSSLRRCLSTSSNNSVISLEELQRLIESAVSSRPAPRSYVLIDVREMSELEHGMIPSAFNVPGTAYIRTVLSVCLCSAVRGPPCSCHLLQHEIPLCVLLRSWRACRGTVDGPASLPSQVRSQSVELQFFPPPFLSSMILPLL